MCQTQLWIQQLSPSVVSSSFFYVVIAAFALFVCLQLEKGIAHVEHCWRVRGSDE
jgi:hypothetical protein